jgi:hypothetical protein
MRLKTTKRLLNLASLIVVSGAGALAYWGMTPIANVDVDTRANDAATHNGGLPANESGTAKPKSPGSEPPTDGLGGSRGATNWGRALRRPLFDPPPPAPVVVVKAPPQPIRARLLATVIESENSTAMFRLAKGQVVFRKVGEPLDTEEPGAEIFKIETGAVSVRRGNEELRLSVEGMNGK